VWTCNHRRAVIDILLLLVKPVGSRVLKTVRIPLSLRSCASTLKLPAVIRWVVVLGRHKHENVICLRHFEEHVNVGDCIVLGDALTGDAPREPIRTQKVILRVCDQKSSSPLSIDSPGIGNCAVTTVASITIATAAIPTLDLRDVSASLWEVDV
jgi:hypothetical protein